MSDDIWRPGGSIDRDEGGEEGSTDMGSGWGSVANDETSQAQSNPFGDTNANAGGKHNESQIIEFPSKNCLFLTDTHLLLT